MIKNNTVILGGEVSGNVNFIYLEEAVKRALWQIGYDERYADIWGDNALNIRKVTVVNCLGLQSTEIYQGVQQDGWGDQGVFVGYACQGKYNLPLELVLARKLNKDLYEHAKTSDVLGLDIKTQITLDNKGHIKTAIAAVPMLQKTDLTDFIVASLGQTPDNIIVNGTGTYTMHSAIADCGITGRKLACDFYSTACPIGGGSPWTKDASKADLTLNLYARKLACQHLKDNDECFVYLSSCIGQSKLPSAVVKTIKDGQVNTKNLKITQTPSELIKELGLDQPIFADLCKRGLMFED